MEGNDPYVGREQTLVKHFILRSYLSRFAPIVLKNWNSITYVDCFSGPWNAHTNDLSDDDAVVAEYGASVRAFGAFTYVCPAIVLHPERDRTHFHLVYGTRHRKGVEVFKDAEKKAMATQETARAAAQERRRQQTTGMASLFSHTAPDSAHYNRLRRHYIDRSRSLVRGILEQKRRVPYDEIWDVAMAQPMTWESDLKDWLRRWHDEGLIAHEGWAPRQKVPRLDEDNVVVWL